MNNWNEHQKLVLAKLDEHAEKLDEQSVLITNLRLSVMQLKTRFNTRSGIFGSIAGFISYVVITLIGRFL